MTAIPDAASLVFVPAQRQAYDKQGFLEVCGVFTPDKIRAAVAASPLKRR
jgi:hypothetical protein